MAGLGYKGHHPGSNKAQVHEFYDNANGDRERTIKFGVKLGLAETTIKQWISHWANNIDSKGRIKPTVAAKKAERAKARAKAAKKSSAAKPASPAAKKARKAVANPKTVDASKANGLAAGRAAKAGAKSTATARKAPAKKAGVKRAAKAASTRVSTAPASGTPRTSTIVQG